MRKCGTGVKNFLKKLWSVPTYSGFKHSYNKTVAYSICHVSP